VKPRETQKTQETQKTPEPNLAQSSEATPLPISDDLKTDKPVEALETTDKTASYSGNTNIYLAIGVGAIFLVGAGWIYKSQKPVQNKLSPTKQPEKPGEIPKPIEPVIQKGILPPAAKIQTRKF
jgi:hypothetical protein